MSRIRKQVAQLKQWLRQSEPVMVYGADFMAFNYGDSEFAGGRDSLITSRVGHARVSRKSGRWTFFPEPDVPLREVSHFKSEKKEISLTFQELRSVLQKK